MDLSQQEVFEKCAILRRCSQGGLEQALMMVQCGYWSMSPHSVGHGKAEVTRYQRNATV